MLEQRYYYRLFLYLIICFTIIEHKCDDHDEQFDINEMFPSFQEKQRTLNITNVIYKNVTIDIEKLDVPKYRKKLTADLKTKIQEELQEQLKNRSARRQVLQYTGQKGVDSYFKDSTHMTRQKVVDLMLQLIYMARHKLQKLERDPYYSKTDTGFRIGFLYRKLSFYVRRLKNILGVMKTIVRDFAKMKARDDGGGSDVWLLKHILLHQHAVKVHNDFLYLYWVLVNLDGKYRDRTNKKPALPKAYKDTGGLSDDDDLYQRNSISYNRHNISFNRPDVMG